MEVNDSLLIVYTIKYRLEGCHLPAHYEVFSENKQKYSTKTE